MSVFLQANVWFPRPSAAEIAALTSPQTRAWAPEDIGDAITGSGALVNPMTTTGDIIYAANTATPATPTRLAAPAAGLVLTGNGVGVAPSWQTVSGFTAFNLVPGNNWGWAGPGSSATNVATAGTLTALTPTATDSTSSSGTSGGVQGGNRFRQGTSAVIGNTTILSWIAGASTGTPPPSMGSLGGAIWSYTFSLGNPAGTDYFAFNFGSGTAAAAATATEDDGGAGISQLAGDGNQIYAFARESGVSTRVLLGLPGSLSIDAVYTLVVDYHSSPGDVIISLYSWATSTWYSQTILGTTGDVPQGVPGRVCLYRETTAASAREILHFSIGVAYVGNYPLSLP